MIIHHIPFKKMCEISTRSIWINRCRPNFMVSEYLTKHGYETHFGAGEYHIKFENEKDQACFLMRWS